MQQIEYKTKEKISRLTKVEELGTHTYIKTKIRINIKDNLQRYK